MIEHHSWLRDLVRMDATFEGYNPADSMVLTTTLIPGTRFDRTVAITVLSEYVAIDPDDDEEDDLDDGEDDDEDDEDDDDETERPPGWSD
jgi:hypothetical protein